MLTFAYAWILFLLPLPWLLRALVPARKTTQAAVRVPFGDRLRVAASDGAAVSKATRNLLAFITPTLAWIFVVIAMARPQWLESPIRRELPTRDLLLLVDLSGSMQQEDFTNSSGEKVDRLTAVKEVLGEFLVRRDGDRVGLVVFGDSPFLQAPFSTDLNLARQLLDETAIGMAGPRTAFGDAIGLGVNLFEKSDVPAKTIIALTDGNDTRSQVPPVEASRVARERGIRIHTVAIGDPTTVGEEKLDTETLQTVAEGSGGKYFFAGDREQLSGIYDELDRLETRQVDVLSHRPRRDLYFWSLLAALAIWFGEKCVLLLSSTRQSLTATLPSRVRVNPQTGELEVEV